MKNFANIAEVKVLADYMRINEFLRNFWILLDIFHDDNNLLFVLGLPYDAVELVNQEELYND